MKSIFTSLIMVFSLLDLGVALPVDGAAAYKKNCQKCHGPEGKGDGPASKLLKGQSMGDLTDAQAMAKYSEDDLFKLISEGGEAVGKSKLMPSYKEKLSEEEIRALLSFIKTLH